MSQPPETPAEAKDTIDDALLLSALREEGKAELLEILEALRGRKCLIIDSQLVGLLNQIIVEGSRFLKDNGVQYFRELRGELGEFVSESGRDIPENIIYLVRPNLAIMRLIAAQINEAILKGIKTQFHVLFVPTQSTVCMHLLESQVTSREVYEKITFGEFRLGLIPFDTDLLSLEMDGVFKQCYVDGDLSSLNIIALALLKLQTIYGIIPNIKSKGLGAKKVLQKLFRMRLEEEDGDHHQLLQTSSSSFMQPLNASSSTKASDRYNQRSEIDTLVVIDREVDLVSPLISPLTYEGLIDNFIGIENSRIKLDASILGDDKEAEALNAKMASTAASAKGGVAAKEANKAVAPAQAPKKYAPGEKVAVMLNNNDPIFAEIRNTSIERLGTFLQEKAIGIRERYTTFRDNKDASIAEIHDFVKKIPKLTKDFKSLNQHINIAELLKQRTDGREFRDQWQMERGMLEGEQYLDQIEELLYADVEKVSMSRILRLLCVQSITSGGIRSSRYDAFRRSFSQTYGYQHLFTLSNLERSGLIRRKDNIMIDVAPVWQTLRKQMRLIDERLNMAKPDDISYVSAGYAPLLVRLVQSLGNNSWAALADVMKLLPGPLLEFTQTHKPEDLNEAIARSSNEIASNNNAMASGGGGYASSLMNYTGMMSGSSASSSAVTSGANNKMFSYNMFDDGTNDKKIMLIFVVGGLSFIEIAAFRFISKDPNFPYRIILATTKLINGSTFVSSMQHTFT